MAVDNDPRILTLPPAMQRATVSAAYPLFMLAYGEERGLNEQQLLAGTGLLRAALSAPDARVSVVQCGRLAENLLELTGDPSIGIELGMRSSLTKVGMIGFGLMSCATYRQAIELGLRFLPIRVPFFRVHFSVDGDNAIFDIEEAMPLGAQRDMSLEYFMVELRFIYQSFMNPSVVSQYGHNSEMWFKHAEPAHFARYKDKLPKCRFNMPVYRLISDARQLDMPLLTANPETARLVIEHCERELALLGISDLPAQVRAKLVCKDEGYPSIEQVAANLCMSTRTLKRKLQAYGLTYSGVLDEVRKRDALQLLAMPGMTVAEVSARVGYSNRVNFTRAFKSWTGVSPSEYLVQSRG